MTIASSTAIDSKLAELKAKLGDLISLDEQDRAQFETDFGRVKFQTPGAVARCTSTDEVAQVVRFCRQHKIPIVARAQGHTQTGQSTVDGGVLLDTNSMNTIHEVTDEYAVCDAGVVWRDLVAHVVPMGLVPRTLTNNLGVTVAGTTSVAGLGVASFRFGAQADNAVEIEVVTGAGDVVTCSREENSDLFNVVRSGLSQFGVITKIKTKLRKCKPKVRKYYLLYDDLGALMEDSKKIMADPVNPTFDSLESWCTPCFQGVKKIGEGMALGEGAQTFAYWLYPLHLTIEYDEGEEPNDAEVLAGLNPYRDLGTSEFTQHEFCERLMPLFELWDRSGYSDMAHPWMETILPWDKAQEFIEGILAQTPPQALGPGGHILLWPCRGDVSETPLFMYPQGEEFVMGWGMLPGVPEQYLDKALGMLDMASELSIHGYEGKRYLSGYITFDTPERWALHFGDRWPMMCEAKKRFDPDGIMNPGFVFYPAD